MARRASTHRTRTFIILVIATFLLGVALQMNGDMTSPFEYSALMLSEDNTSFEEQVNTGEDLGFAMVTLDNSAGATQDTTAAQGDLLTSTGFENAPRNRGNTTYTLVDYFNFSWDTFGGVLYNLWLIMALTVVVIVFARPIGWLIKQFKQPALRRVVAEQNA